MKKIDPRIIMANIKYTNLPIVDECHIKLLKIHDRIKFLARLGANKNDLTEVFFSLSCFYENHLIKEELYLQDKGYPNFYNHRTSHLDFIKEIETLKDKYDSDINVTIKELDNFIGNWIQDHTMSYNNEVLNFLKLKK